MKSNQAQHELGSEAAVKISALPSNNLLDKREW